ncbi:MAG: hypothetical protein VXW65_00330 [Pseudomonadota bacterium]|nr:hypothetical protein [Pseudomonadota bacterium]
MTPPCEGDFCEIPVLCEPTTLSIPNVFTAETGVTLYYRIDDANGAGLVEQTMLDTSAHLNAQNLLSDWFINAGLAVQWGDAGIAPFQAFGSYIIGAEPLELSLPSELFSPPITVHLLTYADLVAQWSGGEPPNPPDYDFVDQVFGESVSVHACALKDWPAY